jgi:hypothetical protein
MNRNSDRSTRPVVLSLVPATADPVNAVRPDRVSAARARIADGYYEREDVQRALAEALLAELVSTP